MNQNSHSNWINKRGLAITARLLFGLLVCDSGLGQSSFWFSNYVPSDGVNAPVFDSAGVPLAGANYLVELWGSGNSNSLSSLVNYDQGYGREIRPFAAGGYFYPGSGDLSVPNVSPGSYAWLQVRAWDARAGATYEQAVSAGMGGYGESALFYARGSNPTADPPLVPAPLVGLQSFSLRPYVPEPSGISLLLLAGAAAWWIGRRNKT